VVGQLALAHRSADVLKLVGLDGGGKNEAEREGGAAKEREHYVT